MPGELIQQALEPLIMHGGLTQFGEFPEGVSNFSHTTVHGIGTIAVVGGTLLATRLISSTKHAAGGHGGQPKPAEVREARLRVVEPWEGGLLRIGGSFYENEPVIGEDGQQIFINDEPQFTKKFHGLIEPGTQGYSNLLLLHRKMVLVNNLPENTNFERVAFKNVNKDVFALAGGMTWCHVKVRDENGQKMAYVYRKPSLDGKRPAGPIEVEQALLNAIMTAPNRAEAAKQLEQIARPEVVKRLKGETDPNATAQEPAFFQEIEEAVHDRFLERGSVLTLLGVNASLSQEKEAAKTIAKPMAKRNKILQGGSKQVKIGEDATEDDETSAAAASAARSLHQETHTGARDEYPVHLTAEQY